MRSSLNGDSIGWVPDCRHSVSGDDFQRPPHWCHPDKDGVQAEPDETERQFLLPLQWRLETHPLVLFGRAETRLLGVPPIDLFVYSDTSADLWSMLDRLYGSGAELADTGIIYRAVTGAPVKGYSHHLSDNCKHTDVEITELIPLAIGGFTARAAIARVETRFSHYRDEEHLVLFIEADAQDAASLIGTPDYVFLNHRSTQQTRGIVWGISRCPRYVIEGDTPVPPGLTVEGISEQTRWKDASLVTRSELDGTGIPVVDLAGLDATFVPPGQEESAGDWSSANSDNQPVGQPASDERGIGDALTKGRAMRQRLRGGPFEVIDALLRDRYRISDDWELDLAYSIALDRDERSASLEWLLGGHIELKNIAIGESLLTYGDLFSADALAGHSAYESAARRLGITEFSWDLAGFSGRSYAGPDGCNLAVALLESTPSLIPDAVPEWMHNGTGHPKEVALEEICLAVVECTRGFWMNRQLVAASPLPTEVNHLETEWLRAITDLARDPEGNQKKVVVRKLTKQIREHPGLERFGMTPSVTQMISSVPEGHAVVVLIHAEEAMQLLAGHHSWRSWALVVSGGSVSAIPLPDAHFAGLRNARRCLVDCWGASGATSEDYSEWTLAGLEWVMRAVVGPVLEDTGDVESICWVPTGSFVGLPLHVPPENLWERGAVESDGPAGPPASFRSVGGAPSATRDEVGEAAAWMRDNLPAAGAASVGSPRVSTYAATVSARWLGYGAGREDADEACVVAVSSAPEQPALDGVADEAALVAEALGADVHREVTAARLAELVAPTNMLHFAGHATRHGLHCSDGILGLGDIVPDGSARARKLGFLSACDTYSPSLGDPDVTLAGMFQTLGFRNVIATLTPVEDESAADVARRFYERIVRCGDDAPSPAVALLEVLAEVRAEYPNEPWRWISWVTTSMDY